MNPIVFLGCPTHDGRIESGAADVLYSANSKHGAIVMVNQSSALTSNCNFLYASALNYRKKYPSLKWFAMLHSDVIPEPFFVDKLIALAEKHEADFMSAVVPIKDERGLTSTAVGIDTMKVLNITQKELWRINTPTFDLEILRSELDRISIEDHRQYSALLYACTYLFANTGCMVMRIDKPWNDQLCFTIHDGIIVDADGNYQPYFFPEDWLFSKMVADLGGKVMCTREVSVRHVGGAKYNNQLQWGLDRDPNTKV